MTSLFNRLFMGVFLFYCGAVTLVSVFAVIYGARKAYRRVRGWLRFRAARNLHRIPDFGRPLDRKEKAAFARIRWRYSGAAMEPEWQQQEDRS